MYNYGKICKKGRLYTIMLNHSKKHIKLHNNLKRKYEHITHNYNNKSIKELEKEKLVLESEIETYKYKASLVDYAYSYFIALISLVAIIFSVVFQDEILNLIKSEETLKSLFLNEMIVLIVFIICFFVFTLFKNKYNNELSKDYENTVLKLNIVKNLLAQKSVKEVKVKRILKINIKK